jgi:hypothetical protein
MYHMRPLPSGQGPFFSPPSELVTSGAWLSLNLLQSRAPISLVLALAMADDKDALRALNESGFDLSRLLLERLEVLAAALRQVKELLRKAADSPEDLQ